MLKTMATSLLQVTAVLDSPQALSFTSDTSPEHVCRFGDGRGHLPDHVNVSFSGCSEASVQLQVERLAGCSPHGLWMDIMSIKLPATSRVGLLRCHLNLIGSYLISNNAARLRGCSCDLPASSAKGNDAASANLGYGYMNPL